MEMLLDLGALQLPARADDARRVDGGWLLAGSRVTTLHPFGATRYYRHGWQSWSQAGWVDLAAPAQPIEPPERRVQGDDPAYAASPVHGGSGAGALEAPGGKVLLLGALGAGAHVEADGETLRGCYEQGGGEWFAGFGDEAAVFARYAALLGERLGRRGQGPAPRVWCSWYSLYANIAEPIMLSVLDSVRGLPFDVFQLDDGWQQAIGDWEANERFPSGMAALAEHIRAAGFTPGLWLAPLIVRDNSRLFREHSEWLLRDERGAPVPAGYNWNGPCYALDPAQPAVLDWLDALVRRVVGWGYAYLKLDFLYAGALPGAHHAALPREEGYRQALERMRAAMGDAYFLACGAPVLPSLGLADGIRVGPDAAPYWDNEDRRRFLHDPTGPGAVNAVSTSLHRLWLRPLVQTDPDVVYFRTRYNLLMPQEQEILRRLAQVAGFRATSDLPMWLDPHELEALRAFFADEPPVRRLGRYRFDVGGEVVDFEAAITGAGIGAIWEAQP